MRSAPCALAPSHPLHAMPSRITRNSHRPRASDRTMVASEATSSLAALSNSMAASPSAETLTRMDNKPNLSREVKPQWAGPRERNLGLRSRQNFFLDIPFYRTHRQRAVGEETGRVENRRSGVRLPVAHNAAFARVASVRLGIALFPVPAHRTEQARFAHSALGESVTRSPTES